MKRGILIAAIAGLAVLPIGPTAASAQTAAAGPTQSVSAPVREVYPRDLMTMRERFDMWRAMRNARTMDEKMELWMAKHAELEKRAAEQGVVLRDHGPMMMGNGGSRENGQRWGGEHRMGMMEGGGMRPQPPMGR